MVSKQFSTYSSTSTSTTTTTSSTNTTNATTTKSQKNSHLENKTYNSLEYPSPNTESPLLISNFHRIDYLSDSFAFSASKFYSK